MVPGMHIEIHKQEIRYTDIHVPALFYILYISKYVGLKDMRNNVGGFYSCTNYLFCFCTFIMFGSCTFYSPGPGGIMLLVHPAITH